MKKILGLDLGTNSIGWALIQQDFDNGTGLILGMGSRIIPMDQGTLGKFVEGAGVSQTADRTNFRSIRRLRERHLLRRERLHRILNIVGFLPDHYAHKIDFKNQVGKFLADAEPKIAYQEYWSDEKQKVQFDFLFKRSFDEMLEEFRTARALSGEPEKKVPYDWTIYYLRKKALNFKIEKAELAWIILNFNQKRGYYQLRGEEEEENPNKLVEFYSLQVTDIIPDEKPNAKGDLWYSIVLQNGWIYRRSSKVDLSDWVGKKRDFIVTTELNDDGSVKTGKEGEEKRSFRAPGEEDWTLIKKKTEQQLEKSSKTVGTFIYDTLLANPKQKIRGELVRTIERKYYRNELEQILAKQIEFHPELQSEQLYADCIRELYQNNHAHQLELSKKDFLHFIVNDIIFYQRPLKSQKSSIGDCALEFRTYKIKDQEGAELEKRQALKAIPKSHPLYQEFRVWQWLQNLKILRKEDDADVTSQLLRDKEALFDFLITQKEVDHKSVIKHLLGHLNVKGKELNAEIAKYTWNYVYDAEKDESKKYPCNETGYEIRRRLSKVQGVPADFLTVALEHKLWHIIYSVTDKVQFEKAIENFARKEGLDVESFVQQFKKFPPFQSEYGSFSEKAIRKLLPLLRMGRHWSWEEIDPATSDRIGKIITAEYDEHIKVRVREKAIHLQAEQDFQGLPLWLAQYIVYDRHSEAADAQQWKSINDIEKYLEAFKQHSLRNPIVEQVVLETLRVVRDIWAKYGKGSAHFFDEIHVELGREMKNTNDERKRLSGIVASNEATNLRIKLLLAELKDNSDGKLAVDSVRPYSPMQQEALKIFEDGVLNSNIEIPEDIQKISRLAQPSKAELQRYKLWLEQRYRSPYTGQMIPLSKLFTEAYQIEHIIPQSRFFDDSFSNKVICEAAVNQRKDKLLGAEFIKEYGGELIDVGAGRSVRILTEEAYVKFVREHYAKNRTKRAKLLMEEIPEKMIERQLNDTRYISKLVSQVLSNIVRSTDKDDGVNSKNLLPGNGKITTTLRNDWGLDAVWNDLILPRFERMNELTQSTDFTSWNENHQKYLPTVPLEFSKGFQKKRIDHRHHALDALVVACATRDHINLLNNEHAKSDKRYDLNKKLRRFERVSYMNPQAKEQVHKNVPKEFFKPWPSFTMDAKHQLEQIIVSFKQNLRVINKTTNIFESYKDENGELRVGKDGKPKKGFIRQTKGDSWAIRKPMHKDTVSGLVQLRKIKEVNLNAALEHVNSLVYKELKAHVKALIKLHYDKATVLKYFKDRKYHWNGKDVTKVEVYFFENENVASRVKLDTSFDEKRILNTVTDTGVQKILLAHLENYKGRRDEKGKLIPPETLAFTPEGIADMNANIAALNNGKAHQPIYKVRTYEPKGNKFNVGQTGNKHTKYVEAAKGTNLFFAVYEDASGKRNYETIPLNEVIDHQKWRATLSKEERNSVPEIPTNTAKGTLLFYLSPNDLVYVPQIGNDANGEGMDCLSPMRIYKMEKASGIECYFVRNDIAALIKQYDAKSKIGELASQNKLEVTIGNDPLRIKEFCFKIHVDRLGHICAVPKSSSGQIDLHHEGAESGESILNEPIELYNASTLNSIRPSTLEKQSDEMTQYSQSLSPLERLRYLKALILNAYGKRALEEPTTWVFPIQPQ
jgi:CRISPR-associated endonuclease Csn1